MKKLIIAVGLLFSSLTCYSQKWERQGKRFIKVSKSKETVGKAVDYEVEDNGKVYQVYQSPSGSCYYLKISKAYLGSENSATIARETGTSYTPRNNKIKPVLSQPKNKFRK